MCAIARAVCYSLFGHDKSGVCDNVLKNVKVARDHQAKLVGVTMLKAGLCVAQAASYPLAIAPACETIEQSVISKDMLVNRVPFFLSNPSKPAHCPQ